MIKRKNQSGLAHPLSVLLVVVVVAVVAFVGWRVVNQNKEANNSANLPQPTARVAVPDKIQNVQDLEKAKAALNQVNVGSDVDPSSLDGDISSLL